MSLFAWLTLANGDQTGLADANTMAVAGKLNRDRVYVAPGEAKPITISCWPQGTTSDIAAEIQPAAAEFITVTGSRIAAPPPAPPPPAMAERGGGDMLAEEEKLGDVRLYRIPEQVTVAARSQKQVMLLKRPAVAVETVYRLQPSPSEFESALERVLVTRNDPAKGLGLPLPAGGVALFGRQQGRRVLIGDGRIDDHAVGEKVEIAMNEAPGIRARGTLIGGGKNAEFVVSITNDAPEARTVEIRLPPDARGAKLVKHEGSMLWRARVPGNGIAELRYRLNR
jgi:hypothetical protein